MTRQEIGKKITIYREKKGISKYSVVKKSKLTFAQLSQIEAGSKNYTIESLIIYLDAIGMELSIK